VAVGSAKFVKVVGGTRATKTKTRAMVRIPKQKGVAASNRTVKVVGRVPRGRARVVAVK